MTFPSSPTATADPGSDLESAAVWESLRCEDCGRVGGVAESERLERRVCWGCYHASFTAEEVAAASRIGAQREAAAAVRSALEAVPPRRRHRLADLALLLETAASETEARQWVAALAGEGVTLR